MKIFAIDPGNIFSAYCVMEDVSGEYRLLEFGKYENKRCMQIMTDWLNSEFKPDRVVIERVTGMGMPAGRELFETAEWFGRFAQMAEAVVPSDFVYRREEKLAICGDSRAKDANIRQALIDRFAKHDFKNGKGTKKDPDFFYGVSADCWAAIAVATTYFDKQRENVVRTIS